MTEPRPGHPIEIFCDSGHERVRLPVWFYWEPDDRLPATIEPRPGWRLDVSRTWAPRGPRDKDGEPVDVRRPSTDPRRRGYRAREAGRPLVLLCPRCPREVPLTSESVVFVCDSLYAVGVSRVTLSGISAILSRRLEALS